MKDKILKFVSGKNFLTGASLLLLYLSQVISSKLSEDEIREAVKEELEKQQKERADEHKFSRLLGS